MSTLFSHDLQIGSQYHKQMAYEDSIQMTGAHSFRGYLHAMVGGGGCGANVISTPVFFIEISFVLPPPPCSKSATSCVKCQQQSCSPLSFCAPLTPTRRTSVFLLIRVGGGGLENLWNNKAQINSVGWQHTKVDNKNKQSPDRDNILSGLVKGVKWFFVVVFFKRERVVGKKGCQYLAYLLEALHKVTFFWLSKSIQSALHY